MPRPTSAAFVGRAVELARLTGAVDLAAAGSPTLTLLGGDAGSGKTRLLDEFLHGVRSAGALTLLGSCVQVGDYGLPYLPIVDALRAAESDTDGAAVLREQAAVRPALARLLPQLRPDAGPADPAIPATSEVPATSGTMVDDGMAQGQLFEALLQVLTALGARRPVVLALEDLHWADRSTRDFLAFLARTLRDGHLAVVASYRTDDLHRRHPLRPLLAELNRLPHVRRVELAPFNRGELAELLDGVVGAPVDLQLVDRVFARSEGNAFFAEELIRAGAADDRRGRLPDQLSDILLGRIEELGPAGRAAVRVAAVAGRRAPHDLLVAAADVPDLEDGLRSAVDAGLLTTDGDTYDFRHALYQEAVYGDLLPGERVRLHARFADLLTVPDADGGFRALRGRAGELAHHLLAGHDLARALQASINAATSAENMAAPGEALRHLEQALELQDRVVGSVTGRLQLLRRAAEAAAAAGDAGRAVAFGRAAVVAADGLDELPLRVLTRERLARLLFDVEPANDPGTWTGSAAAAAAPGLFAGSDELCRQALLLLPAGRDDALRAQVLATRGRSLLPTDQQGASLLLAEAMALAGAIGAEVIAADVTITLNLLLRRGFQPGDGAITGTLPSLADVLARVATVPADEANRPDWLGVRLRALRFLATQLMEDGDLAGALAAADDGVALSARAGVSWGSYGLDLRLLRGWVLAATGAWDEVLAESSGAAFAPTEPGRVLATQAVAVLVARGDPGAEALLTRLRGTGDTYAEVQLDLCELDLRLAQRQFDRALAVAAACAEKVATPGWGMERLLLAARHAAIHADIAAAAIGGSRPGNGRVAADAAVAAAAIADGQEALPVTPGLSGPHARSWRCRVRAEADRAAGRDTPQQWQQVHAFAVAAGRIPEQVYAALRGGRLLLESGSRDEAAEVLRPALAQASSLKSAPWVDDIQELMRRGRLSSDPTRTGPARSPLTAREAEVLALVARGLSNRSVGQALFISEKTASVHLSHIMAKLDAATRTEAVAVARERGLLPG